MSRDPLPANSLPTREEKAGFPRPDLTASRIAELRLYESVRQTTAEPYTGKVTDFKEVMWFDASTWKNYELFDTPTALHDGAFTFDEYLKYAIQCPNSMFFYTKKTILLSYGMSVDLAKGKTGIAFFNDNIEISVLGDLVIDDENKRIMQRIWMSLTPMEMMTQRSGIEKAEGRVVIGGLGLGWFLTQVAAKENVTEIIVVESSKQLLDWVSGALKTKFPKLMEKVSAWVHANVYDYMVKDTITHSDDTKYLLDIWPLYGDVDYDPIFVGFETIIGTDKLWGWGRGSTYGDNIPAVVDIDKPSPASCTKLKKPCAQCPFGRESAKLEEARDVDPLALLAQAHSSFVLPCHMHTAYAEEKQRDIMSLPQCAGAAIYRANVGVKLPAVIHSLPADKNEVFATPTELVCAHTQEKPEVVQAYLNDITIKTLIEIEQQKGQVRVIGATQGKK